MLSPLTGNYLHQWVYHSNRAVTKVLEDALATHQLAFTTESHDAVPEVDLVAWFALRLVVLETNKRLMRGASVPFLMMMVGAPDVMQISANFGMQVLDVVLLAVCSGVCVRFPAQFLSVVVTVELIVDLFWPGSQCHGKSHLEALRVNCASFTELSLLAVYFLA